MQQQFWEKQESFLCRRNWLHGDSDSLYMISRLTESRDMFMRPLLSAHY